MPDENPDATNASPILNTSKIGRYTVIRELGRGAMGVVYLATDPTIDRMVAVKTVDRKSLPPGKEGKILLERLAKEARSAGKLSHPGIVTIYDLGESPEFAYVVMEFIEGLTLADTIAEEPMAIDQALWVVDQAAAALDYAHSQGVLHRDIKPANLMITPNGAIKVLDFGIARLTEQQTAHTSTVLGTPSYMAPEQITNQPVSGAADQFSLAVMAFEMLSGQKPFQGDSITGLMFAILQSEPKPLRSCFPGATQQAETVFRKALAKLPADRYASCSEFAAAFRHAFDHNLSPEMMEPDVTRTMMAAIPVSRDEVEPTRLQPITAPPPPPPPTVALRASTTKPEPDFDPVAPPPAAAKKLNPMLIVAAVAVVAVVGFLATRGAKPDPAPTPAVRAETPTTTPSPEPAKATKAVKTPVAVEKPAAAGQTAANVLVIRTTPDGASVKVGDLTCTSPCGLEMKAGDYKLSATLEGYRTEYRQISVPKQNEVVISLAKPMGTLMVSGVAGATVSVDGHPMGQTPLRVQLNAGDHKILVEKDGKKIYEGALKLMEDDIREITTMQN